MGNCSSCCCTCCKYKHFNKEHEQNNSDPISVITVQPTIQSNIQINSGILDINELPQPLIATRQTDKDDEATNFEIIKEAEKDAKSQKIECPQNDQTTKENELTKTLNLRRTSSIYSNKAKNAEDLINLNFFETESNSNLKRSLSKRYKKLLEKLNSLKVLEEPQPQKTIQKSKLLMQLLYKTLLEENKSVNFMNMEIIQSSLLPNKVYVLNQLDKNSSEYEQISFLFTSTNKWYFKIQKIERIFNPYLLLQYRLKYLEYVTRKKILRERLMFHGTSKNNIDSICKHNFDWRLNGRKLGTKNGKGVNFASNAYFATHYGDEGYNKVMIVVKVLIGKSCKGTVRMPVPPNDIDTTTDGREKPYVFVKYDDNTFYPFYIIYYGGIEHKKNKGKRRAPYI